MPLAHRLDRPHDQVHEEVRRQNGPDEQANHGQDTKCTVHKHCFPTRVRPAPGAAQTDNTRLPEKRLTVDVTSSTRHMQLRAGPGAQRVADGYPAWIASHTATVTRWSHPDPVRVRSSGSQTRCLLGRSRLCSRLRGGGLGPGHLGRCRALLRRGRLRARLRSSLVRRTWHCLVSLLGHGPTTPAVVNPCRRRAPATVAGGRAARNFARAGPHRSHCPPVNRAITLYRSARKRAACVRQVDSSWRRNRGISVSGRIAHERLLLTGSPARWARHRPS